MSAPAPARIAGSVKTPTAGLRFAAVVVLIGLAALAGYTMFSGPTTVPSNAPPRAAPATPAPAPAPPREEGEGGDD